MLWPAIDRLRAQLNGPPQRIKCFELPTKQQPITKPSASTANTSVESTASGIDHTAKLATKKEKQKKRFKEKKELKASRKQQEAQRRAEATTPTAHAGCGSPLRLARAWVR